MTWNKYINREARKLAECKTLRQLSSELDRLQEKLERLEVPKGFDFWGALADAYEKQPKPLLKEAEASAALNALLSAAQAVIRARGKK